MPGYRPSSYEPPPPWSRPPAAGAAGYGPSPYHPYPYPGPIDPATPAAPVVLRFGTRTAFAAGLGTLLVLISLAAAPWFSIQSGLGAGGVRALIADRGELANGLSVAYFSWLSWALLASSAALAIGAAWPRPALSLGCRIAGPLVAGFAALFAVLSVQLTDATYGDQRVYVSSLTWGFWLAVLGFAIIGAAALTGPRKVVISSGAGTAVRSLGDH